MTDEPRIMTDEPKLLIEEILEAMSECPYWDNEAQALALARVMLARLHLKVKIEMPNADTEAKACIDLFLLTFAREHGLEDES